MNTAGWLIALVAVVPAIGAALWGVKHRVSAEAFKAAAEAHESNTKAERERGDRLERELRESRDREMALQATIKKLEALPDMTVLLKSFEDHERRSQERHEAQMKAGEQLLAHGQLVLDKLLAA